MTSSTTTAIIVGIIIGTASLARVFYVLKQRKRIKATGVRVEGVVLSIRVEHSKNGSTAVLTIQYTAAANETITGEYRDNFYPSSYHEGDRVNIIYDVENCNVFILDGKIKTNK